MRRTPWADEFIRPRSLGLGDGSGKTASCPLRKEGDDGDTLIDNVKCGLRVTHGEFTLLFPDPWTVQGFLFL